MTLLPPQRRGFTVNEFVVVLAITLIVSLVFAYLTRDVLLRVRVARVMDEQALLKRAIQNYTIDWRDYPAADGQLHVLVAPTTYIASLPADVFSSDPEGHPSYRYYRQPGGGIAWVLVSPGPDGVLDFAPWSGRRGGRGSGAGAGDATDPEQQGLPGGPTTAGADPHDLEPAGPATSDPATAWAAAIQHSRTPSRSSDAAAPDAPPLFDATTAPLTAPIHRRAFLDYVSAISYDPTNGSMSGGDIILISER